MRPPRFAVVLALCCVLAGCNGLVPGGTTGDAPMPTVTPAELPEDETETYPPGLAQGRLVDGSTLLAAHGDVLANRSVVVERHFRELAVNGTELGTRAVVYRFAADRSRLLYSGRGLDQRYSTVDVWVNESAMLYRHGVDDPRYELDERAVAIGPESVTVPYELRLSELRSRPVETTYLGERDGYDRFRVTVPGGELADEPNRFVVDERGFISEVHTGRIGHDGTSQQTSVEVSFTSGDLERPDWVTDARETIANREYVVPGVTSERIVNTQALREAHTAVLANTSGTYVHEQRREESDGTVFDRERVVVERSTDPDRYLRTGEYGTAEHTYYDDRWSNATVTYHRSGRGNDSDYDRRPAREGVRSLPSVRLPDAAEVGQTTIIDLGDGRYRISVTDYYGDDTGRRGELLVAVVDDRGFVSSVREGYTVVDERGTEYDVVETTRYTNVGNTTVERPDWLPDARNATSERPTALDASVTIDTHQPGTAVVVDPVTGDPLAVHDDQTG
ncbi:hypothetical protein [Halomarina rubra]|uniref:Outer membrane lipoprotein-sorting protein n=1 Tax=Halomarina rubra TaxID=2071873 RepID=A0ABD6AU71_9EURY|nr:hypothetical protein [Halomarina rubra]